MFFYKKMAHLCKHKDVKPITHVRVVLDFVRVVK